MADKRDLQCEDCENIQQSQAKPENVAAGKIACKKCGSTKLKDAPPPAPEEETITPEEEPETEVHSKHSPDGKKNAAEQNADRASIEKEIRRYIKRDGGFRKNLPEADQKRAMVLLKKIKRKIDPETGEPGLTWDERITPTEFKPKYNKMQVGMQP